MSLVGPERTCDGAARYGELTPEQARASLAMKTRALAPCTVTLVRATCGIPSECPLLKLRPLPIDTGQRAFVGGRGLEPPTSSV